MNDYIMEFIKSENLITISEALKHIADNGIPIIDTYAPITTTVNIITTIFATAFGGWVTIQLFKRQERMRIREELRLEFYKEYRQMYKELYKDLVDLFENIKTKKSVWDKKLMYIESPVVGALKLKNWNCYYPREMNKDSIKKIKEIHIKSQHINEFLNNSTVIFEDNSIYNDIHIKIDEIKQVYIEVECAYKLTFERDEDLRKNLNHIDEQIELLNNGQIANKYNEEGAKNHLINVEKRLEEYKQNNVDKHNDLIPRILDMDKELNNILSDIKNINSIIEREYINKYFKKTIWKKIKTLIKQ